jgi:hypothetical protein
LQTWETVKYSVQAYQNEPKEKDAHDAYEPKEKDAPCMNGLDMLAD